MTAPARPANYQEALLAAAALRSTAGAAGAEQMVRAMSDQVIETRTNTAAWAKRRILEAWNGVDAYDSKQIDEFADQAAAVMSTAQAAVSRATAAAQTQQLSSMGVRVPAARPTAPVDVRATDVTVKPSGTVRIVRTPSTVEYQGDAPKKVRVSVKDSSTRDVFLRPAEQERYTRSTGASDADAKAAASNRITSLVDDNLMLAQRLAEAETLAKAAELDNRVIGYRRVIHPELSRGGSCGMCVAAADRKYKVSDLKPIHANCKCTVAAITKDFDPGHAVNQADLNELYDDAKGSTNAALKRTRYQVDEHGELGAVLVPAAPHKRRGGSATWKTVDARDIDQSKFAANQVAQAQKRLDKLLADGKDESDKDVMYARKLIARFQPQV